MREGDVLATTMSFLFSRVAEASTTDDEWCNVLHREI
jgi:hypothetical protein